MNIRRNLVVSNAIISGKIMSIKYYKQEFKAKVVDIVGDKIKLILSEPFNGYGKGDYYFVDSRVKISK